MAAVQPSDICPHGDQWSECSIHRMAAVKPTDTCPHGDQWSECPIHKWDLIPVTTGVNSSREGGERGSQEER